LFRIEADGPIRIVRLTSPDGTNRLTSGCVRALTGAIGELRDELKRHVRPLIITGNRQFFSVGADLNEIAALTGPEAYEFSGMGQALMNAIAGYPAQVVAAIEGHCMGGGLDLALACQRRIAAPHAVFGHRGAALGLMTGLGRDAALAAADREGKSDGTLCRRRKNLRGASARNWIGGCDRRRSRGGGYASTASESLTPCCDAQ
jgi:enoyl-CoA hydratase/carnithine racemase